jgi:hypothetical protein
MPLRSGSSESVLRANIAEEVRSGRSAEQAVAMSLRSARKAWRRSHPTGPFPHHLRRTGGYRASRSNRAAPTEFLSVGDEVIYTGDASFTPPRARNAIPLRGSRVVITHLYTSGNGTPMVSFRINPLVTISVPRRDFFYRKESSNRATGIWGLGRLPPNVLIHHSPSKAYPRGAWGFVGSVDARLGYVSEDGSEATPQQLADAASFGPRLAGVKSRLFRSKRDALAFARSIGVEVSHSGKHGGS